MLSENMRAIYRRLLVLGVLCACLAVFASSPAVEQVFAAECVQDCWSNEERCYENCNTSCQSSDASCESCIDSCRWQADWCNRHSIWCEEAPVYNGRCDVQYGWHCPYDPNTGGGNCNLAGSHQGYYMTCETLSGTPCVSCPDQDVCWGQDGTPPCP